MINRYLKFFYIAILLINVNIGFSQESYLYHSIMPRLFDSISKKLREQRFIIPNELFKWTDYKKNNLLEKHASALGIKLYHSFEDVEYSIIDTQIRKDYIIKKIIFESTPDVIIPAHLYIPNNLKRPAPAILNVHGHWHGSKNAQIVHTRCVFLAHRGFVVLSLDAIGSGERSFEDITYHGRQLGYQVLPMGLTLAGLQIEDNRRAIDLLISLKEVDKNSIGVTGASGGGNQAFNVAIFDKRIKATVAVCFFGSYEGYLRGAHCACELIPNVLTYMDEGIAASLIAPRSLMILAAKEDKGAAFQIDDARKNAVITSNIYKMASVQDNFQFLEFEGGHDYSRLMREKAVTFFEKHLTGKNFVNHINEPKLDLISSEDLRVIDNTKILENSLYVPQIAAQRANELITDYESRKENWAKFKSRYKLQKQFIDEIFGGFPVEEPKVRETARLENITHRIGTFEKQYLTTEKGVVLELKFLTETPSIKHKKFAIIILGEIPDDFYIPDSEFILLCSIFPRGTGLSTWKAANAVNCKDYLLAQGSNVLGRPIIGQWVWDALQVQKFLKKKNPTIKTAFFGEGIMGFAAILTCVLSKECEALGVSNILASLEWPDRFDDSWELAHFVPNLLHYGDIAHFISAIPPRILVIGQPRNGAGIILQGPVLQKFTERIINVNDSISFKNVFINKEITPSQTLEKLIQLIKMSLNTEKH